MYHYIAIKHFVVNSFFTRKKPDAITSPFQMQREAEHHFWFTLSSRFALANGHLGGRKMSITRAWQWCSKCALGCSLQLYYKMGSGTSFFTGTIWLLHFTCYLEQLSERVFHKIIFLKIHHTKGTTAVTVLRGLWVYVLSNLKQNSSYSHDWTL